MNRNDAFSRCHPLVNFLYFALVLLGAMLLQHPVCQAISLIGAIACFCTLGGEKPGGFRLWYALVLFAVTAAVNPAFSHEGRTILPLIAPFVHSLHNWRQITTSFSQRIIDPTLARIGIA